MEELCMSRPLHSCLEHPQRINGVIQSCGTRGDGRFLQQLRLSSSWEMRCLLGLALATLAQPVVARLLAEEAEKEHRRAQGKTPQ